MKMGKRWPNVKQVENKEEPVPARYTKKRMKKKKVSVKSPSVKRKKKKNGAANPLIQMKGNGGVRRRIKG